MACAMYWKSAIICDPLIEFCACLNSFGTAIANIIPITSTTAISSTNVKAGGLRRATCDGQFNFLFLFKSFLCITFHLCAYLLTRMLAFIHTQLSLPLGIYRFLLLLFQTDNQALVCFVRMECLLFGFG